MSNASFNFDNVPTVALIEQSINNIDDTFGKKVANSKTKPFPIKKSDSSINSITVTKTKVGARKEAGKDEETEKEICSEGKTAARWANAT